jgi:type III restriction enzyme
MAGDSLANPILNSPYDPPQRYFEIAAKGPTGEILEGRRPSESYIPVPLPRKGTRAGKGKSAQPEQVSFDFDGTRERRERNGLINGLRRDVDLWRARSYDHVTPVSRKLLQHWADESRENRVLYCQREAAETAIFLAEVAGRHGYADWRAQLQEANAAYNEALPRVALKMATGSGKTVVMAMLIAWQSLNKLHSPSDKRFARRFLVVTPGITIRDRLRVLHPEDPGNYYDERDLVPTDLRSMLGKAQIVVTNYHAFQPRDAKEIKGVAGNTRKILLAHKKGADPFKETESAVVSRVLRNLGGTFGGTSVSNSNPGAEIVVFNDEAHHCYVDRPQTAYSDVMVTPDAEAKEANEQARVWFRGLQSVAKKVGIKTIYDMSATPYFLAGSGYNEGHLFPWTVSDFSLMDAIESGIVKVPRTPVDDDAGDDRVTYLTLWEHIGADLPKRGLKDTDIESWRPRPELQGALESLYRSYERAFDYWQTTLASSGEPPPVFIVVCNNTSVSRLVYDWVAGRATVNDDARTLVPGNLPLFSNVVDGQLLDRPRSILVDSAQLESGEALKPDFKMAAATEIDAFKAEFARRSPGADVESITDEDLLREVMNSVGKRGRLGEGIRCVVSVSMLTEGWDANTVTHILGIRAFRSQLLCEQVVGRGLRRRSYAVNADGRFDAEYASVYGVPFAFIPTDKEVGESKPPAPVLRVASVPGREHLRITFPRLSGYRLEIPDEDLWLDVEGAARYRVGRSTVPTWTENAPIVGEIETIEDDSGPLRPQAVAFHLARRLLRHEYLSGTDQRPWLFPRLVTLCKEWIDGCVDLEEGFDIGTLVRYAEWEASAAEAVYAAIASQQDNRRARVRPILHRFDPVGSTADVRFDTRKKAIPTERSEVSHVVLDGPGGNTWEQLLAEFCENPTSRVAAYVKNDHLGFSVPYVHKGRTHAYVPDFLLRLERVEGDCVDRVLIVEVSGGLKSAHAPGSVKTKSDTARDSWCAAVNNHGGFGRWGYLEITDIVAAKSSLVTAIDALYADLPITGDPDLLETNEVHRGA